MEYYRGVLIPPDCAEFFDFPYPEVLKYTMGNPLFWYLRSCKFLDISPNNVDFKTFYKRWPKSTDLETLKINMERVLEDGIDSETLTRVSIYRYIRVLVYSGKLVPGFLISETEETIIGSEMFVCPVQMLLNLETRDYMKNILDEININPLGRKIIAKLDPKLSQEIFDFSITSPESLLGFEILNLDTESLKIRPATDFQNEKVFKYIAKADDIEVFNILIAKYAALGSRENFVSGVLKYSSYNSKLFKLILDNYLNMITSNYQIEKVFRYKSYVDFTGLAILAENFPQKFVQKVKLGMLGLSYEKHLDFPGCLNSLHEILNI